MKSTTRRILLLSLTAKSVFSSAPTAFVASSSSRITPFHNAPNACNARNARNALCPLCPQRIMSPLCCATSFQIFNKKAKWKRAAWKRTVLTVLLWSLTACASSASSLPTLALSSSTSSAARLKAELELCYRLLFAAFGGALVGLERSTSDHPAGIRTMALVSLGACAFTLCSMFGFLAIASSSPCAKLDPSRMASNVASGVGFIGAGVITNNRKSSGVYDRQSSVNGLTTAAAIWVAAAVGVASGVGLYVVSGTAAATTIAILRFSTLKDRLTQTRNLKTAKKSSSSSSISNNSSSKSSSAATVASGSSVTKDESFLESTKMESSAPSTPSSKIADPLVEKYLWGVDTPDTPTLAPPPAPSSKSSKSSTIQVQDILDAATVASPNSSTLLSKISIEEEQQVILTNSSELNSSTKAATTSSTKAATTSTTASSSSSSRERRDLASSPTETTKVTKAKQRKQQTRDSPKP
mmetsp:Transcript_20910/g.30799  ORF Transcript_20910/g.30799 Transcript_20910/m.30799 type:complete len:469 (+) Transcript_20910:113-1519(+)